MPQDCLSFHLLWTDNEAWFKKSACSQFDKCRLFCLMLQRLLQTVVFYVYIFCFQAFGLLSQIFQSSQKYFRSFSWLLFGCKVVVLRNCDLCEAEVIFFRFLDSPRIQFEIWWDSDTISSSFRHHFNSIWRNDQICRKISKNTCKY